MCNHDNCGLFRKGEASLEDLVMVEIDKIRREDRAARMKKKMRLARVLAEAICRDEA